MNKEDKAKKRAEILAECEARRKEAMEEIMKLRGLRNNGKSKFKT